jgi:predicted nucleotidyltransferase
MKNYQNIRLSDEYIETIKALALKFFDSEDVRIFGSRSDINKKGGDIDIYIKTDKSENILKSKLQFLTEFEKIHGQQKIDLIVEYKDSRNKPIFGEAKNTGVRL